MYRYTYPNEPLHNPTTKTEAIDNAHITSTYMCVIILYMACIPVHKVYGIKLRMNCKAVIAHNILTIIHHTLNNITNHIMYVHHNGNKSCAHQKENAYMWTNARVINK